MHSKSRGEACSYLAAPNIAVGFKKECSTVLHWPALVLYYNIARALHNTMRALPAFGACGYSNADPLLDGWRANLQATTVQYCSVCTCCTIHTVPCCTERCQSMVSSLLMRDSLSNASLRDTTHPTRDCFCRLVLYCAAPVQYSIPLQKNVLYIVLSSVV